MSILTLSYERYRLVYQVVEERLVVVVVSVGKREDNAAYRKAGRRVK